MNKSQIENRKLKIGIVGLGYVGLPLAVEFGKKYSTIGLDLNKSRIKELNQGVDKTLELTKNQIESSSRLSFTHDAIKLQDCNIYIVTVPTPVDDYKNPDLKPLKAATGTISKMLSKDNIVIYESTVFPGCTEEVCVPILEKESGYKYNKDFFCGYSPERINPGDTEHTLTKIIKVTSGSTPEAAKIINELYKSIIPAGTHLAPNIATAEAAKVIENIQRDINIALMNEFSMIFDRLDLNTNDVLEAAGTKWNFLKFHPGLVGGHCIGVDPYYLTYKAQSLGLHPEMILSGRRTNDSMGKYVAQKIIREMTSLGISLIGAKVGIFGITFKPNCPDVRNTKVVDVINELKNYNCQILVTDPMAEKDEVKKKFAIDLVEPDEMDDIDFGVLAVEHNAFTKLRHKNIFKII
tara:strand:- start:664 stop:1887 length:1224 start_codon:yes stop_codon:yes gene_type:complete